MTAQNMGTKILTEAGYEVVAVSNGSAALKKIAEHKPDLVILDVYMPGYSGLEVCEKLRNSIDTLNTPVLLTVGKMEPYRREDANRVKADGIIIKPFEASDLLAVIKQLEERIVPVTTTAVGDQTMYLERPTLLTDEYRQEEFSVQSASITQHPPLTPLHPAIEVPDYMASTSAFSDLLHTAPPPPAEASAAIPEAQAVEAPAPAEDVQPEPAAAAAETSTPFHVAPAQWNWERAPEVADYSTNSETSEPAPERTQKIPRYEEPEVATAPPVSVDPAPEEVAVPSPTNEPPAASLSVPDMLMSNADEAASTADAHYGSIPAVDPALVTDRTELASSFATRFGVKNLEPVSDAAELEPAAMEVEHTVEAPETNFESPAQPEATNAVDNDFDARVAAAMSAYEQPEAIAPEPESLPAEVETAEPVADTEQTELQPAEPVSEDLRAGSLPTSFVENHPRAVADTAESEIQHYGHEIAASITSELPVAGAAASSISANPKVISEIVHPELDRIKPHLVEESLPELTSGKKAE